MISEKDQERIARLKEQADKILVQVQELENKNMAASNSGIVLTGSDMADYNIRRSQIKYHSGVCSGLQYAIRMMEEIDDDIDE